MRGCGARRLPEAGAESRRPLLRAPSSHHGAPQIRLWLRMGYPTQDIQRELDRRFTPISEAVRESRAARGGEFAGQEASEEGV